MNKPAGPNRPASEGTSLLCPNSTKQRFASTAAPCHRCQNPRRTQALRANMPSKFSYGSTPKPKVVLFWVWRPWSSDALKHKLFFGMGAIVIGCSIEHERCSVLGMDAPVIGCSRTCLSFLGTDALVIGCSRIAQGPVFDLGMDILVIGCC